VVGSYVPNLSHAPLLIIIMQIKSKWTMRWHLKHLHFRTFLMVSWVPIWCLFMFLTKASNIHNSRTSATPKVGIHLGVIRIQPLCSFAFVRMFFTRKQIFGLMGLCTSHLVLNPILRLWQWRV
jgi:hypothetical protein